MTRAEHKVELINLFQTQISIKWYVEEHKLFKAYKTRKLNTKNNIEKCIGIYNLFYDTDLTLEEVEKLLVLL